MSYVLIIGAKSDIAKALAKIYAKNDYDLYLCGRNINKLDDFSNDLKIRSKVMVDLKEFDITNFTSHQKFYQQLTPKPLGIIIVAGYMAEQKQCEANFSEALNTINVNYTGAVSILNIVADDMEKHKQGFIVGTGSVAGDRGRKTNYIYGSSKAAFSTYLSGLRNRLFTNKISVLTVKPGFVDTKMTQTMDLPKKLTAKPETVANAIYKAQQKGKDVLYTKSIWWFIMLVIKHIPERLFKRMSL